MKNLFKKISTYLKQLSQKNSYTPAYRILDLFEDENKNYTVHIQIINKNLNFHARPEELLAKDNIVDKFSPRDVRTLTYLGYLGINAPKYKILAQRMVDNKTLFVIKKRGEKNMILKTGDELMQENEIISSMESSDAQIIGYTVATEDIQREKSILSGSNKDLDCNKIN
jgi:hypothetical protein